MAASIRKKPLGRFRGPGESSGKRIFWALWEPDGTVMRIYVGERAASYALFPPGAFDECRDMADVRMATPKDRGECRVEGGCAGISDAEAAKMAAMKAFMPSAGAESGYDPVAAGDLTPFEWSAEEVGTLERPRYRVTRHRVWRESPRPTKLRRLCRINRGMTAWWDRNPVREGDCETLEGARALARSRYDALMPTPTGEGGGGECDAYEAEYVIERMTRVNPDDASDVDAEYVESRDFWREGLDAIGGVWYDK